MISREAPWRTEDDERELEGERNGSMRKKYAAQWAAYLNLPLSLGPDHEKLAVRCLLSFAAREAAVLVIYESREKVSSFSQLKHVYLAHFPLFSAHT